MEAIERILSELKGREDFLNNCMKSDEVKARLEENKRMQVRIQAIFLDNIEVNKEQFDNLVQGIKYTNAPEYGIRDVRNIEVKYETVTGE